MRSFLLLVVTLVTLGLSLPVSAQSQCATTGVCSTFPFMEDFQSSGLMGVDFDSNWLPGGSPLQVRATLHLGGQSAVRLVANEGVSYPPAVRAAFDGQPGGYVSIDYGFSIHFYFRFNVLGIGWEGEIPIPFIPNDLALNATSTFDDLVLAGAAHRPIVASDVTSRVRVASYDLGAFLAGLVSGGVALDLQGMLSATYNTQRISVDHALVPITSETGVTTVYPASGNNYGASINVVSHAEGSITHVGAVHVLPTAFVGILGQGFSLDIADLPFNLISTTTNIRFPDVSRVIPLPDLRVEVARVEFGEVLMGDQPTKSLIVYNDGDAPMDLEVILSSSIFGLASTGTLSLAPHSSIDLQPSLHAIGPGNYAQSVVIRSNDPDYAMRTVTLAGKVVLPVLEFDAGLADGGWTDAGDGSDGGVDGGRVIYSPVGLGGCGCSIESSHSSSSRSAVAFVALAGLLCLRVRRRAAVADSRRYARVPARQRVPRLRR